MKSILFIYAPPQGHGTHEFWMRPSLPDELYSRI